MPEYPNTYIVVNENDKVQKLGNKNTNLPTTITLADAEYVELVDTDTTIRKINHTGNGNATSVALKYIHTYQNQLGKFP